MDKKALEQFYTVIGNEVRMARSKSGLSQTDLFKKTGIHRETISRIECGSQQLSVHQLILLCKALNQTPDNLLKKVIGYETDT